MIVGRSEVLRPEKERSWLTLSRSTSENDVVTWNQLVENDRFGLAYQRRIGALTATAARETP